MDAKSLPMLGRSARFKLNTAGGKKGIRLPHQPCLRTEGSKYRIASFIAQSLPHLTFKSRKTHPRLCRVRWHLVSLRNVPRMYDATGFRTYKRCGFGPFTCHGYRQAQASSILPKVV